MVDDAESSRRRRPHPHRFNRLQDRGGVVLAISRMAASFTFALLGPGARTNLGDVVGWKAWSLFVSADRASGKVLRPTRRQEQGVIVNRVGDWAFVTAWTAVLGADSVGIRRRDRRSREVRSELQGILILGHS